MNDILFQWDESKNLANITKHKISFEEAKTVFFDENARLIPDPEHSATEERFIILGLSAKLKLLIVVHTYKGNDEVIRIISARKATKSESKYYHEVK
ncbi:MAG: BrnT family toxin [Bacteroidetes bacterium]|nr:BrnT family toxin [Bacteroidota bacterium]MBU1116802.1 BrnT family toxin [Bacteroidota bacterium]MBU1799435.1 BrnT family toxin [Bacteroidota bacterium]